MHRWIRAFTREQRWGCNVGLQGQPRALSAGPRCSFEGCGKEHEQDGRALSRGTAGTVSSHGVSSLGIIVEAAAVSSTREGKGIQRGSFQGSSGTSPGQGVLSMSPPDPLCSSFNAPRRLLLKVPGVKPKLPPLKEPLAPVPSTEVPALYEKQVQESGYGDVNASQVSPHPWMPRSQL